MRKQVLNCGYIAFIFHRPAIASSFSLCDSHKRCFCVWMSARASVRVSSVLLLLRHQEWPAWYWCPQNSIPVRGSPWQVLGHVLRCAWRQISLGEYAPGSTSDNFLRFLFISSWACWTQLRLQCFKFSPTSNRSSISNKSDPLADLVNPLPVRHSPLQVLACYDRFAAVLLKAVPVRRSPWQVLVFHLINGAGGTFKSV